MGEEDLLTQERPSVNKNCWYQEGLRPTPTGELTREADGLREEPVESRS